MPSFYARVEIDEDELLSDVSDKALAKEFERRGLSRGPVTNAREKRYTLTEVSDILRKIEKIALAARIDELMMELEI